MPYVTDLGVKPGYLSEIFVSFQGEGAHVGRRHLFVRLAGCNIRCRYCDTPDSLERTATYTVYEPEREPDVRRNPIEAEELKAIVRRLLAADPSIDAVALTGGEPLTQSDFLAVFLAIAQLRVPVLLESNGMLPRRLREIVSLVDIVSMDIKLPSNTGEAEFWEAHAEFLELARAKDLYAKILVDAGTTEADVERATQMVASVNATIPIFLQPIVDAAGHATISASRLADIYKMARRLLNTVRVLPQTHKLLGIR